MSDDLCERTVEPIYACDSGEEIVSDALCREFLFENALDLLTDGIALLRQDGGIVYANAALRHLAERNGDFRIDRNAVEFATPDLRNRFAAALCALERARRPGAADLS